MDLFQEKGWIMEHNFFGTCPLLVIVQYRLDSHTSASNTNGFVVNEFKILLKFHKFLL